MDVKNTHSVTKTEISVFGRQALDAERRRSPSLADKVLICHLFLQRLFLIMRKRKCNLQTQSGYAFVLPLLCRNRICKNTISSIATSDTPISQLCPTRIGAYTHHPHTSANANAKSFAVRFNIRLRIVFAFKFLWKWNHSCACTDLYFRLRLRLHLHI